MVDEDESHPASQTPSLGKGQFGKGGGGLFKTAFPPLISLFPLLVATVMATVVLLALAATAVSPFYQEPQKGADPNAGLNPE